MNPPFWGGFIAVRGANCSYTVAGPFEFPLCGSSCWLYGVGAVVQTRTMPPSMLMSMASLSRGNGQIGPSASLVAVAVMMVLASCTTEAEGGGEIETVEATALVEDVLLPDGEVHLTVQAAAQAYSEAAGATAVAAMVSVTGADSICMFWYIEGEAPDDGLIIADAYARQFSPWGASVDSPEDEMVMELKSSREGVAVFEAISCGPYR